jgi:uncharacterized membrane-anchored protein YjiN (DUF445 family)
MSKLKVSDFAELYGLVRNNVYTYGKRNKILISDGVIDTEHPINKLFLANLKTKNSGKHVNAHPEPIIPVEVAKKSEVPKEKTKRSSEFNAYDSVYRLNDLKEKKLRAEIAEIELRNKTKAGELIPYNYVITIFQRFVISNATSFYNASDNMLNEICEKLEADLETTAKLRSKLKELVNKAIENAQAEAKKDISLIIKELKYE